MLYFLNMAAFYYEWICQKIIQVNSTWSFLSSFHVYSFRSDAIKEKKRNVKCVCVSQGEIEDLICKLLANLGLLCLLYVEAISFVYVHLQSCFET